MSVETRIEAADGWFAGEAKTLRYEMVDGDDASTWSLRWELRHRRGDADDAPLVTKTNGAGATGGEGFVEIAVPAADTETLGGGDDYHAVLWRTDPGFEQVLAYGGVVIRKVTDA